ncbi:MAG: hypothetical protein K2Y26_12465 [Gemmatimonadaceae bacterium]|nr:hypothetical protein [Gemmatimonadaceae bacterium]
MMRSLALSAFAAVALSAATLGAQSTPPAKARTVSGESAGVVAASARPAVNAKGDKAPSEIVIARETYSYSSGGRRDPYKSLMSSADVRPLLSDLRLVAVAFDPVGNNSVAILRDSFSKVQYRVRTGHQLGRLRVSAIKQKAVQFTIEEFGFNRQETLPLSSDTTKARNP